METGSVYQMTRANDVYSGLGKVEEQVAQSVAEKTEEQETQQLPVIVEVDENGDEISDNKPVETVSTAQANAVATKAPDETEAALIKALEAADHLTECLDGIKVSYNCYLLI